MPSTKAAKSKVISLNVKGQSIADALDNFFITYNVPAAKERLEKLIAINAPEIIIENERKLATVRYWQGQGLAIVSKAAQKEPEINGLVAVSMEVQKGRGGKPWFTIRTESGVDVAFFPHGHYGAFIKIAD